MALETAEGGSALPPVLLSMLPPIATPYANFNGLQGVVSVSGNAPAYFSVDFPATVDALKYPVACGDPTVAAVDVTYMSDGASVFASQFGTYLLPAADLYDALNSAINSFMGAPVQVLSFTVPRLTIYKPAVV